MKGTTRRRPRGLLSRTILAIAIGLFVALTGISELTVLSTDRPTAPPPGLSYVATDGFRTRFEQWGRPSGHPIVLIHGAFESVRFWAPTARVLEASHHVEAYDLKGYGYTTHVGPYTTEALSRQLFAFLEARHLSKPVLVGHSLGAGVIAQFVLDHPTMASGIVFLDGDGLSLSIPGSGILTWMPGPYRSALFRSGVRSGLLVRTIFDAACGPGCPTLTPTGLAAIQRPFEVAGAEDAFFSYAAHPIVGVTTGKLLRIRSYDIPARVVVGSADMEFSAASARQTARRLGAPYPIIIKGAGHLSMWSHPRQVAASIESFLAGLPPGP